VSRLAELRARRSVLIARAQREREGIAAGLEHFAAPLKVVDAGLGVALWLRKRPEVAGLAAALAVAIGTRRGLRWMRFALAAWQAWRWVSAESARG
jgi:YqjK-like protein